MSCRKVTVQKHTQHMRAHPRALRHVRMHTHAHGNARDTRLGRPFMRAHPLERPHMIRDETHLFEQEESVARSGPPRGAMAFLFVNIVSLNYHRTDEP